jgi:hypothetical protein
MVNRWAADFEVAGLSLSDISRSIAGVPNGIFKEVAQSLRFKIKGSAHNVVKAR